MHWLVNIAILIGLWILVRQYAPFIAVALPIVYWLNWRLIAPAAIVTLLVIVFEQAVWTQHLADHPWVWAAAAVAAVMMCLLMAGSVLVQSGGPRAGQATLGTVCKTYGQSD